MSATKSRSDVPLTSQGHPVATSKVSLSSALRWSKRPAIQRYTRLVKRLAGMGPLEIGQRASKVLSRRLGLTPLNIRRSTETNLANTNGLALAIGTGLQQKLSDHFDRAFFFGPASRSEIIASIQHNCPDAKARVTELAQTVGNNGLSYLGLRVPIVAGKFDWQADPQSGTRVWTTGALDEAEAISATSADVKYVWEVNRQQFLPILGRAYWFTGDTRYAQDAVALIDDWIAKNPVGLGVNWCSHLEVAMRAIAWIWTMPYLLALPGLSEAFIGRWLESIEAHFHHLCRNLSVFTDPTNHLIGEATALWMLCVCFPALPGANKESKRALLILTREVERQIASDGVNCEQATSYHRFVLDFYLQILVLARRNGIALSPAVPKQIESMIEFVAAMAGSDGAAPMIGDSDDARGMPFLELVGWDFKDTLSTGAVLFKRERWKRSAGDLAEVSVWLIGAETIAQYKAISSTGDHKHRSTFPSGGYYFSENIDATGNAELIFDVGPLGLWPNAAHGHADALSILIRLNGKLLLTDPGTGAYFGDKKERDYFRSTSAHNTVTVDDLDQADLFDTFKWVNPMKVRVLETHSANGFSYVAGEHDGYRRLRAGVTHQRAVLATGSNGWIIVDRFEGKGRHSIKRHFNFHPDTKLEQIGPQSILAWDPICNNGLRFDFAIPNDSPQNHFDFTQTGLWSGRYGDIQRAPHLVVETVDTPEITLLTFVTPIFSGRESQSGEDEPTLEGQKVGDHSTVYQRRIGHSGHMIEEFSLINPSRRSITMPSGHICNARFAYLARSSEGLVQRAFLIGEDAFMISSEFQLRCQKHEKSASFQSVIQ